MPRKRFSAFDDFPVERKNQPDWQPGDAPEQAPQEPENADTPAEQRGISESTGEEHSPPYVVNPPKSDRQAAGRQAAPLFSGSRMLAQPETPQVERIERLKPSQMIPDRFQPRRLLPTVLRQPFYSGQIDCYQAASQWLKLAKNDSALKEQVDHLLAMGLSFSEHGQIKPITGSWVEASDGSYLFQIETGERRFWAACLQMIARGLREEPLLRVEVVAQPTRMRQVLENRHAEPPSAVGQACEVAALILAELGIPPQTGAEGDEFDYFRQARGRRMPDGMWDKITPIMDVSRPRLMQLLKILELPTPMLELADRYRVPERVLRVILDKTTPDRWEDLLLTSIRKKLTAEDLEAQIATSAPEKEKKGAASPNASLEPDAEPIKKAMRAFERFSVAILPLDEGTRDAILDELANDLVLADQGETMLAVLQEFLDLIRIRQENRYRKPRA